MLLLSGPGHDQPLLTGGFTFCAGDIWSGLDAEESAPEDAWYVGGNVSVSMDCSLKH